MISKASFKQSRMWMTSHRGIIRLLVHLRCGGFKPYSRYTFQIVHIKLWTWRGDILTNQVCADWPQTVEWNCKFTYVWCLTASCIMHNIHTHSILMHFDSEWRAPGSWSLIKLFKKTCNGSLVRVQWYAWWDWDCCVSGHCFNHRAWAKLEEMCFCDSRMWCAIKSQTPPGTHTHKPWTSAFETYTHTHTVQLAIH